MREKIIRSVARENWDASRKDEEQIVGKSQINGKHHFQSMNE